MNKGLKSPNANGNFVHFWFEGNSSRWKTIWTQKWLHKFGSDHKRITSGANFKAIALMMASLGTCTGCTVVIIAVSKSYHWHQSHQYKTCASHHSLQLCWIKCVCQIERWGYKWTQSSDLETAANWSKAFTFYLLIACMEKIRAFLTGKTSNSFNFRTIVGNATM